MYQTPKDDFIIKRVKELREQNRKTGRIVGKWDLFAQAKADWEEMQSQQQGSPPDTGCKEQSEMEERLQTVSDEYWTLLRQHNHLKLKVKTALTYLEQCSFPTPLSREDYLNRESLQKALEQLHGVIY